MTGQFNSGNRKVFLLCCENLNTFLSSHSLLCSLSLIDSHSGLPTSLLLSCISIYPWRKRFYFASFFFIDLAVFWKSPHCSFREVFYFFFCIYSLWIFCKPHFFYIFLLHCGVGFFSNITSLQKVFLVWCYFLYS